MKWGAGLTNPDSINPATAPTESATHPVLLPIRNSAVLSKPDTHAVGNAVKCSPCL